MAYLVLARHGQSEWNALSKWTGRTDVGLTEKGKSQARHAAVNLQDIELHKAYTSELSRAQQTLDIIKQELRLSFLQTTVSESLNERDYGAYEGMTTTEVIEEIGHDEFIRLRRRWDHHVPEGETLKEVYERVIPYYEKHILTDLKNGKNVIIVAHGNTLRALIKYLDQVSDNEVDKLEINTAELHIYEVDEAGKVLGKNIRN